MKALVAIDSFKGALSSLDAGSAAAKGIARACSAQVQVCAVADGGEGTTEAVLSAVDGRKLSVMVKGPLWEQRGSMWARATSPAGRSAPWWATR